LDRCHLEQVYFFIFFYLFHTFKNIVGYALEVIPKTLAQNCGVDVVRTITELRAKHSQPDGKYFGIEGNTGKI
jgi:chaperonin GroEL (HSP60 family)